LTRATTFALVLALGPLAGCSSQPVADAGAVQAAAPSGGATASAGEATASAETAAGARTVTGTVLETMDASSYTYVRVDAGAEQIWAAASTFEVAVGDRVVVPLETPMENFHSKSLNRDFPMIYFASAITREGQAPAAGASPAMAQMPMSSHPPARAAATVTEPIAQPAGGTPIATVWADRKALAGKTVTVRGKVVKFNGGILDHDWIHIQDGTGKADDRTNDLTVTTAPSSGVKVGDVITVTGVLAVDKDFGAGYAYPVIVENAKIAR
jgi:hypothetical protein